MASCVLVVMTRLFVDCQQIVDLGEPRAIQIFTRMLTVRVTTSACCCVPTCMFVDTTEQMLELHRGQGMDIFWRDASLCPNEDDYREMVKRSMRAFDCIPIYPI